MGAARLGEPSTRAIVGIQADSVRAATSEDVPGEGQGFAFLAGLPPSLPQAYHSIYIDAGSGRCREWVWERADACPSARLNKTRSHTQLFVVAGTRSGHWLELGPHTSDRDRDTIQLVDEFS